MKLIFFATIIFAAGVTRAQVGIGTTTPSTNSALDVSSANKGLMLPRVNDTGTVSNPTAGLLIYNKATKTPAFHNGTEWSTLATLTGTTAAASTDSITYTITNAATGFRDGTYPVLNISNGASNPNTAQNQNAGSSIFQDLAFVKLLDVNSLAFSKAVATALSQVSMVIEFKMFAKGELTPYYSIKCTNITTNSFNIGLSTSGKGFAEQITISPEIFGYKNWVSPQSFSWNQRTRTLGGY